MPANFFYQIKRLAHGAYMAAGTPYYASKVMPVDIPSELFPWAFLLWVATVFVQKVFNLLAAIFRRDDG